MEGIDAHVTPEGDTVLTMVSDDNFSHDPAHAAAAIHAGGVSREPRFDRDRLTAMMRPHTIPILLGFFLALGAAPARATDSHDYEKRRIRRHPRTTWRHGRARWPPMAPARAMTTPSTSG